MKVLWKLCGNCAIPQNFQEIRWNYRIYALHMRYLLQLSLQTLNKITVRYNKKEGNYILILSCLFQLFHADKRY